MAKINKALISVADKSGIVDFATELARYDVQFISTGGTARLLRESGLCLMDVSDYTGYPELMDGRVKTLHPRIHGGVLGDRSNDEHLREMDRHNIEQIDMIVINVPPFRWNGDDEETAAADVMSGIDIGGTALIRSAAKNFESVTVGVDSGDYDAVLDEMRDHGGAVSQETNLRLAVKALEGTSRYDGMVSDYLRRKVPAASF